MIYLLCVKTFQIYIHIHIYIYIPPSSLTNRTIITPPTIRPNLL